MEIGALTMDDDLFLFLIKKYSLSEVGLFGSVLRDDFGPESDIDFLVRFEPGKEISLFDIIRLKNELEGIFKRKVDVVEIDAIQNPFFKEEILKTARTIYAA